jgi:branched-chain amino acid transport system substrate-binding protein
MKLHGLLAILLGLLSCASGAYAVETVPIGIASNFSEPSRSTSNPYGDYFRNGVRLALSDAAPALEKRGLRVELQEFDYGTSQVRVLQAAKQAAASNVIGVVGYNFSSHALLAAPIHQQAKLPMLTPSATANRLGQITPYVHTACFNDAAMAQALAGVARNRLRATRAAIVVDADCAYCQDLAHAFENEFIRAGGSITVRSEVLEKDTDFTATIAKLKAADYDAILVPNQEAVSSARIIAAVMRAEIHKPFLGGDGWGDVSSEFFSVLGDLRPDGYSVSHWHSDYDTAKSRKFVRDFKARFGKLPNDTAVLAYDATRLMVEAILKAKERTRTGLETAFSELRKFSGVTGDFRYQADNGVPLKSVVLLSTHNRRFEIAQIIPPAKGGLK